MAQVDSECFGKSRIEAGAVLENRVSNYDVLNSEQFTKDMRISQIRGCTDSSDVLLGVTLILTDSITG